MSTTTPAPPRRPLAYILSLLALACCWYFYTTDEEHYLLYCLFLVAQIVAHITIRSNLLDGLTIACIFFAHLGIIPVYLAYIRDGTPSMHRSSQVRNIVIAMHNYHQDHNKLLTTNVVNASGKPLLSWRVTLLPYLDEENLYRQFRLDEPWSSPHNIKLLEKIPKCYQSWRKRAPLGHTQLSALTGPGTIFEMKTLTLGQVTIADGTSNTAVIAESGRFIPWTMPDDEFVDDTTPPYLKAFPGTSRITTLGFLDGSVITIRDDRQLNNTKIRKLVTWNGGEQIGDIYDFLGNP